MPIGSVDWIAEGMLLGSLDELDEQRFVLPIRNQFFHGAHPLGWIRDVQIRIDAVQAHEIALEIRDQVVPLKLVRTTSDIWWYPRETALLHFRAAGLPRAATASVHCHLEVSTFFFTPAIDRTDRYPTMRLDLDATMPRTSLKAQS